MMEDPKTKLEIETPFEHLKDDDKGKLDENNKAKMTIYNALPHKEYDDFTRFNAIVTGLKSFDKDYTNKNHVQKFLLALPLRCRLKVTTIEEAKDLAELPLDELIDNLKVYKMVLRNDGVISKSTKEKVKSLALKAKLFHKGNEFGRANHFSSGGNRFRKSRCYGNKGEGNSRKERVCYNCGDKSYLISECQKLKENKAFIGGAWSDSEDDDQPEKDVTCLMAINSYEEAAKFVRDFKSLANEADESLAKHKALELEIERLLRAVVSQDIMSIVQNPTVVETSDLQTELEPYKDMQQKIERLQAQLGDQKGKSKDTPCVSDTLDPLSHKLENENVDLEFQLKAQLFDKVSEQKDITTGTGANTKFANQSTVGKPFLQHLRNYSVVRQPNAFQSERPTRVPPKVVESNDLSNPVTSNSVPITTQESKVMNNKKVIAPGMFRINPTMNSRVNKFVPDKPVKASVRTKLITVSQPRVITKKDVNSKTSCFSPKDAESTTRTRRPQPRNNPKNDKVYSKFKSSCLPHNFKKIKENHSNLKSS
ncbi:hypothetical protein Tco_0410343 [Tanacetum coccineum]